jgi:hypothetical protein
MASAQDLAASVLKRYQHAEGNRGTWESHWEEIARRVLPSYAGSFMSRDARTAGEKRTEEMVDATAALALPKFAAAMESMLTPRNSTWHRLEPSDPTLKRNRSVRMWYDSVNEALFKYRYAPRANYASQQHEAYISLGAFGTGAIFVDALDRRYGRGLRYRNIHLAEIYFLENHQGLIDTALRRFEMTARQAAQKFGIDKLPRQIAEAANDTTKCEQKFWFVHEVRPRGDDEGYDPRRLDAKGMAFASLYVTEINGPTLVSEGGYHVFPIPVSRYVVAPGETYGRSPSMLALPAIKTLNEQKKTVLKQGHRSVDPVLLAHDDGIGDAFSMRPGAMNSGYVTADGRPLVHTLPVGNLALAKEMLQDERAVINDAFLVTLFQILVETPQMTATEVLERVREKGALLSPTMGRQQSEMLGPLIERELDVLSAEGLLPPMPPILRQAQAEYETVYDSPLSRAQRAESAAGALGLLDWVRDFVAVTQDPSATDYFDLDAALPEVADIRGVPARWIRDKAAVDAIREARAKQAEAKQMIEAAPAAAGVMKALPQVRLNGSAGGA